jgi:demethylmenaquinone methyltransferase / 2-methoxy-6-polyprenyl-1,4-benzoquinol methylase
LPDRIEIGDARDARWGEHRLLELADGSLGLIDSLRVVRRPQLGQPRAELGEVASARALLRELAESGDRDGIPHERSVGDQPSVRVHRQPPGATLALEGAEVDPLRRGLRRNDAHDLFAGIRVAVCGRADGGKLVLEAHEGNNSDVGQVLSERNRAALALFAPLAATYDRYARLLSFGQDPRWRRFLVSRIEARPDDRVLDVACGTGAVARELRRRYGCAVVGVDQSTEMLTVARSRSDEGIELFEGRAEALPFTDASFDGLTFTYLLRYVDDPAATMREIARVVRPGGPIAMLEFSVPQRRAARAAWELYVRAALPLVGRAISPGWHEVGRFLGPSIRAFWREWPPDRVSQAWRDAGIECVAARPLSLGGGVVVWGRRGS